MPSEGELWALFAYTLLIPYAGWFASRRMGRSFWTWVGLSLLVSPVIAMIFLMLLGPQKRESEQKDQAGQKRN